ncbi:MAG: DUF5107 domain-containing protein, partial [Usitatibacteraceae bacterium]
MDTWPRNAKGVNQDILGNYKEGVGLFAVGSREEFMGAYVPGKRAGLVHVAKFEDVPGKKTWTWGPEQWPNQNLSDDNSTYIEIQAGVMPSQEDHDFLNPQERKIFTEYWIPARNLGGISRATVDAVAYVGRASGQLIAELNVTRAVADAVIEIRDGADAIVLRETASLSPETAWNKRVPAPSGAATLRILDAAGVELLTHTEGKISGAQPGEIAVGKTPPPAWLTNPKSAAEFTERAIFNEREAHLDWALIDYDKALAIDPASAEIRKHRGRLLTKLGQWSEASASLSLPDSAGDLEARYYAALASKDAKKMEGLAGPSPLGSAAAIKAAEWRAAAKDLEGALALVRRAAPSLIRAGAIEVALLRAQERWDEARTRLDAWLALDPTDAMLRYEQDLPVPAEHPLVWLYRAYCRQRAGLAFDAELERAASLPLKYIFPNRVNSLDILQGAWANRQPDANQRYLLGLLLLSMRRTDDAIAVLDALRTERPQLPALHRTLGRIWLDVQGNKARA